MISNVKKGTPREISVEVNLKEKLLRFRLFNKENYFGILLSLTAIKSRNILVQFKRC